MAICPECLTLDKPFFARRCHACNSRITFLNQLICQSVYVGTIVFGLLLIFYIIKGLGS